MQPKLSAKPSFEVHQREITVFAYGLWWRYPLRARTGGNVSFTKDYIVRLYACPLDAASYDESALYGTRDEWQALVKRGR